MSDKPVIIHDSIDKAISEEFESMLKENKDDILLQELINLHDRGKSVQDIDLNELISKLNR